MSDPMVGATTAVMGVHLSVAVPETVAVQWETVNGTAIAGVDYEAANGTVTFAAGETEKQIEVVVYGADVGVNNPKNFYVKLHPPTNAILFTAFADCMISVVDEGGVAVTKLIVAQGKRGLKGDPGLSAYEQAVLMGYEGTVEDWMNEIADASQAAARAEAAANTATEQGDRATTEANRAKGEADRATTEADRAEAAAHQAETAQVQDDRVITEGGQTQRALNTELKKLLGGFVSSESVGLVPDSDDDQTEKLRAFFAIGGALKLKKGVYKVKGAATDITIKSNTYLDAYGAVIDYSEATNESTGRLRTASTRTVLSSSNLTADAQINANSVTVADASSFSPNGIVFVRSDDAFSTDATKCEVLKIAKIEGNVITFCEALQSQFLTANNARVERLELTQNVVIMGLKMIGRGSLLSAGAAGLNERAMLLSFIENLQVTDCKVIDFDRISIHVNNVYNFNINKNTVKQPAQKVVENYNQYGISYTDSTRHGFITENVVLLGKHGIVSSTYNGIGYAVDVNIVNNIVSGTWHAGIATHKTNSGMLITDNLVDSCIFGIDIRVPNVEIVNNRVMNTKSRALVLRDMFNNLNVKGNVFRGGVFGILVESAEISANIDGVFIQDNTFDGFTNTVIEGATGSFTVGNLLIKNNLFKNFSANGVRLTGTYGVHEIKGNEFNSPASVGYAIRLLGIQDCWIKENTFIDVSPLRYESNAGGTPTSRISAVANVWNKDTGLISAASGNANSLFRLRNVQLGKSFSIVGIVSNAITISAGTPFIIADSTSDTTLSTINASAMHGDELVIMIARSVITVNSTGNIRLASNCVMSSTTHTLKLVFNGTYWCELSRQTSST